MHLVVGFLVLVGVLASIGRSIAPDDAITRFEPVRTQAFAALHITDPFAADRHAELARVDGRFASHRALTLVHVIPGGLFLLLAPLQFMASFRRRHIRVHRWLGRALVAAGTTSVLGSLYFGIVVPYGGTAEAVGIALIAAWFLFSVIAGSLAIWRGGRVSHGRWMTRAFAAALGISVVRMVGIPLDIVLTQANVRPGPILAASMWVGLTLSVGITEWRLASV